MLPHPQHLLSPWLVRGVLFFLLLSTAACQQNNPTPPNNNPKSEENSAQDAESRLVLNNATLEQSNSQGQVLWKIQVEKATYSKDQKIAQLNKIKGNIYEKGKVVLYVSAEEGQVYKAGEEIFLRKNIVATDPRNGTVIRSQEVEWRPKENLLIIRKNFQGSHEQVEASAKEGKYYTTAQKFELVSDIIATAKDPRLQLKTDHLFWLVPEHKLIGDRPLNMVRYKDKTVTDKLVADRAEVQLKNTTVIIKDNIEYRSTEPPLQIASAWIEWNYKTRQINSNVPIRIFHYGDNITLTGNRAEVDLNKRIANLKDGVQGINNTSQNRLYANQMTWFMPDQIIEAIGNVVYEQINPKFNLTGDKATGTLKNNNIVVISQNQDRVVTEIYPEQ